MNCEPTSLPVAPAGEANERKNAMESRKLLYPLMVVAAIAVTTFSALGIATMMGYLPGAHSSEQAPLSRAAGDGQNKSDARGAGKTAVACANCGIVESIRVVERRGSGTGLGAVAGGLAGALVGNQFGGGNGRTALTVLGGVGGAYAGNEIERNSRRTTSYEVRVRLDNGGMRTVYEGASPAVAVGEKVRLVNGTVVPLG